MVAAASVGRLGPLAAALGIGTALLLGGVGNAAADTGDDAVTSAGIGPGAHRIPRQAHPSASAAMPKSAPAPAAARRVTHAVPRQARAAVRGGANRTAAAATPGWAGGLGALLNNQTPTLAPTQTGQNLAGAVSGQLNPSDSDSDMLAYTVTAAPTHGAVIVAEDGGYTYTPEPAVAVTGTTDSFSVAVTDAGSGFHIHGLAGLLNLLTFGLLGSAGHTGVRTVTVVVAPFSTAGNNPPTGSATVNSPDPITGVVTGSVLGSDVDGDLPTYSTPPSTAKGSVSIEAATGAFSYTPTVTARVNAGAPGATAADGLDAFTVTVSDGRGGTAAVVVTVPVTPSSSTPADTLAAFPGAEGFGAYATGGRGGSVIYVTNLNAAGPGSLQWAIDQPGARYILFKVSGVINTQIHLTNGEVTIAGQTSPGGITIRGLVTDESPYQDQAVHAPADFAENWILQHIRIRPGLDGPGDDGLRIRYTRNAIVDHVSIGNATDEAIEISYSHDITVQNTLIAETVGGHSFYGGILMNYSNPAYGFGLNDVSLHHNVFDRIEGRLPEGSRESQAAANSTMNLELSDNLYWDPNFFVALANSTGVVTNASGDPYPIYWKINAVNNYFHTRTAFPYGMFDDQILRNSGNQLYVSGNQMNLYPSLSDYQLFYCCNDFTAAGANTGAQVAQKLPSRNPFPLITYTPTAQVQTTLLNTVGAWPRDPMDIRLLQSVATNTIATAPRNTNPAGDALLPAYSGTAPVAPVDTDSDGMPDTWETVKGLNPTVADANGTHLSSAGYTDLEVYLYELSESRITGWSA